MEKNNALFGDYVVIDRNHTEEELMTARDKVVELICGEIRRLAKEAPEKVFIEKELMNDTKTVACKVEIIT